MRYAASLALFAPGADDLRGRSRRAEHRSE